MSELAKVFQNKKAFIGFVVADDPDADSTVKNVVALAEGGADLVELGIPFSDPVADGPVIQEADLRAFKVGVTPDKIFEIVAAIRKETTVPLVFLTYLNIVFKYGYDKFCARCQKLGVSGLIIPDMPYEEKGDLAPIAAKYAVDLIPLVTPTSGHRIEKIVKHATGFIYVVSSMGVTGTRNTIKTDLHQLIQQIRQYTDTPTAIGFGVHTPEQASELGAIADGVIVGSAIVKLVAQNGTNAAPALKKYAQEMKAALPVLSAE
ncbi:tryptophan synthase subunit alpha [Loigolactobacillus backii]|uniref:Tryptophan synthase alpha chain n=1 Tax=Loigolactobacillus backii TaxID=375175 RepID=A0A192GZR0_9LACO|nr:tryptophan synthase subunit alpha [Loigolactobacillus backii]ANK58813.1 tryptophan synthase subunit alpha [Loigolactobacillus backii]ANK61523.1 tryptophan synthase subunit alpha [Loigolactobacillus backii]ANK63803.1 tryptophan synthase subunit alpha [Loigolactobacillus backii]ANK66251.1 tryptophan synthase subunit alpha [Loigolactobacillus backii]ANK69279.1 tryptophan synthase subunit alpha [Loigolactobacillus backii]